MTDYRSLSPADVVAMVTKTASHEEFQIKSISLPSKSRTTLHFSNKLSNKQQHHDECSVTEAETDFSESFCASLENIHSAGDEDDSIFGPYDNEDDPTQSSFSEGEEEEAQEILAPANILPIPSSPPIQQRRKNKCRASRFPSVKLAPSLNDLEEKRDNEESEQTHTEPTPFLELITTDVAPGGTASVSQATTTTPPTSSCLKKDGQDGSPKSVRFAINSSGRTWCLTQSYQRVPEADRDLVWWSFDELEAIYQEQYLKDIDDELEEELGYLISDAFDSVRCPTQEIALMNFASFFRCADLRGLEKRVFDVHHFINTHRFAVLAAQAEMNGSAEDPAEDQFFIDCDLKLEILSLRSIKYSHPSRLVALKLAECDASVLKLHEEHEDEMDNLADDMSCASSVGVLNDLIFGAYKESGSLKGASRKVAMNLAKCDENIIKLFEQHEKEMRALKDDSSCVSSMGSDDDQYIFGVIEKEQGASSTLLGQPGDLSHSWQADDELLLGL